MVDVGAVYQKIKEISLREINGTRAISVNSIAEELNSNREIIQQYVVALTLLELIQSGDTDGMISIK